MTAILVNAGGPGDSFTVHVECIDEHGKAFSFPIEIEVQKQDKPRLVGVKVMNRPVLLRSSDVVFNAGSPLEENQPGIVAAIARDFPTFGGGRVSDFNPITHWTKDGPVIFAAGVDVDRVVRFVIERLNEGRS